jgi:lysophospholipase L1-like esterase
MLHRVYPPSTTGLKLIMICAWLSLAASLVAAPYTHDVNLAEECRSRDGLPNVFTKLQADGPVRIAYLGGSITAAQGWRPKTTAWFKAEYPHAQVVEINAAISGTGSDYGACRLRDDVLARNPDLVFLECRVNGGGGFEKQSVEGIVRQIWKANPQTDVCFVYTIGQWMLKELQAGQNVAFGRVMESIANAYGIPSIDLGVEVAKREKAGTLVFKTNAPVEGKLVFSADGVHPGDAGHDLYRDVITRSLLRIKEGGRAQAHVLPAPLQPANWETATLLPVTNAVLSAGWVPVDISKDTVYIDDRGRTHGMLRGAVKCQRAGETITVKWNGTTVGMSDIPYGEPCVVAAVIDGGNPVTMKRLQTEKIHKYARFWYLPEQPPGLHTVTFTLKSIPEGSWFYAGQLLIVGSPPP